MGAQSEQKKSSIELKSTIIKWTRVEVLREERHVCLLSEPSDSICIVFIELSLKNILLLLLSCFHLKIWKRKNEKNYCLIFLFFIRLYKYIFFCGGGSKFILFPPKKINNHKIPFHHSSPFWYNNFWILLVEVW